jgi:FkbM family methyltransferase
VISKLRRWWRFGHPYRKRFGLLRGLRITKAMADARYKRPAGELVPLQPWPGEPPLLLRAGSVDVEVFNQVIVDQELALKLDPPPATILDAGANIGISVRTFARQWPAARILAVEFEPGNVRMLTRNCAHLPQVTVAPVALWYGSEWVQVADPAADAHSFSVMGATPERSGAVRAYGVRALMEQQGWSTIDLVKLDIEGAEREVLAASAEWLPYVRYLVVELHDRLAPGCSAALSEALDAGEWDVSTQGEYAIATRRGSR